MPKPIGDQAKIDKLKDIIERALHILDGKALPTNTVSLLNTIREILELADTTTLLYAPATLKLLSIPFIVMLLDHALSVPPISLYDPKTIMWLSSATGRKGALEEVLEVAYKAVHDLARELKVAKT